MAETVREGRADPARRPMPGGRNGRRSQMPRWTTRSRRRAQACRRSRPGRWTMPVRALSPRPGQARRGEPGEPRKAPAPLDRGTTVSEDSARSRSQPRARERPPARCQTGRADSRCLPGRGTRIRDDRGRLGQGLERDAAPATERVLGRESRAVSAGHGWTDSGLVRFFHETDMDRGAKPQQGQCRCCRGRQQPADQVEQVTRAGHGSNQADAGDNRQRGYAEGVPGRSGRARERGSAARMPHKRNQS